jgi:hypothetical protein
MEIFRIVRTERVGESINMLLSDQGLDIPYAPLAMITQRPTPNPCGEIWLGPQLFWLSVDHPTVLEIEGLPEPTTAEDYIKAGCPL